MSEDKKKAKEDAKEVKILKNIPVESPGIFKCPCEDDGAIHNPDHLMRLGKYNFWPCQRCMRQIEAVVMTKVVVEGARLAIESNFRKQELAGRDPLAFLKNQKGVQ